MGIFRGGGGVGLMGGNFPGGSFPDTVKIIAEFDTDIMPNILS